MKNGFLILLLCIAIHTNCYAQSPEDVSDLFKPALALPTAFYSSDSEGFDAKKIGSSLYPYYEHGNHYAGVNFIQSHFSQNGWERNGSQYSIVARDIFTPTGMGYDLNLGINTQGGHQILTTDINWGKRWNNLTATELFINRDWVESQNSLDNGIYHTFTGISAEQKIADRLTVIGLVGEQYFSDGNMRPHGRARLIYDALPDYGVTLQLRGRAYYSSDSDVNGNYFNPRHYHEEMFAVGMRRRIEGWVVNGTAGLGQQYVNSGQGTTTKLIEVGVTSPIVGKIFLRTRAGYNQAAGVNGPDYSFRYIQSELVFAY